MTTDSWFFFPLSGYIQPTVYAGPTITTLQSSVNSTHWKWIYRCQNCTSWTGGTLQTNSQPVLAWAIGELNRQSTCNGVSNSDPLGLTAVTTPSSAASNFAEHDDCKLGCMNLYTPNPITDKSAFQSGSGVKTSLHLIATTTTSTSMAEQLAAAALLHLPQFHLPRPAQPPALLPLLPQPKRHHTITSSSAPALVDWSLLIVSLRLYRTRRSSYLSVEVLQLAKLVELTSHHGLMARH